VIRRIRQIHEYIRPRAHRRQPGRGELDNHQEINFPPIMEALIEVANRLRRPRVHPTRDPLQGPARSSHLVRRVDSRAAERQLEGSHEPRPRWRAANRGASRSDA